MVRRFGLLLSIVTVNALAQWTTDHGQLTTDEKLILTAKGGTLVYLGVESGNPPSTGIVAPVVGVWRVAK